MTRTGVQDRNSSKTMLTTDGSTSASTSAVPWGPRAMMSRPRIAGGEGQQQDQAELQPQHPGRAGRPRHRVARRPPAVRSGGAVPYGPPYGTP